MSAFFRFVRRTVWRVLLLAALVGAGWYAVITFALPPTVEVIHPVRGPAVESVYATGTVEASVMMPIAARSPARLMELNADEGSKVAKGQILGRLEDDDLQNNLKQLLAREAFARSDYDRAASLVKQGVASRKEMDRAQAEWEAAQADVARAQAQIDFMKLTAPADGVIIRRDGEIGQLIAANQPVFWLSCCAPLRISAEVDEEDIPQVQPGQKVLIQADAFPGKVFTGKVQSITPKGDPVARSYRVRIAFDTDTPLLIGMTAEVNIILSEKNDALLVPSAALANGSLWVVQGGKLIKKQVTSGARGVDHTEIQDGVSEADLVVNSAANAALKEGGRVRAQLAPYRIAP